MRAQEGGDALAGLVRHHLGSLSVTATGRLLGVAPERISNLVAGISVAGLMVPEAIAYAGIANVPPAHALAASVAGLVAYLCIGGSRFALVAPTSSSATVFAAAVMALAAPALPGTASPSPLVLGSVLVSLAGLLFLAAAAARMGHLAAFISRPVLRGFAFGLAITIVARQLPHLAGVAASGPGPLDILLRLVRDVGAWNPWSIAIGGAAYLGLRLLRRRPLFPAALTVVAVGVAVSAVVDLPAAGVALVGPLHLAVVHWAVPHLAGDTWLHAVELAVPLVVILYAESWGSIRTLALRHGDRIEPDRELVALGAANLLSSLVQGLPVGAGFSASAANEDAGAHGKGAGLVAVIAMVGLLWLASSALALLPVPVLAAVVISALSHALDPSPLVALWRLDRDQLLAACAVLAVILLGVLHGMMLAVLLSVLAAVRRFSRARVSVLGELGQTRDYVDIARHPEARAQATVLVVRPEAPLFFANAEQTMITVRELAEAHGEARTIVLSLEESNDLDSTALEAIAELHAWMVRSQRRLVLARAKEDIRDLLARSGSLSGALPCFWSVADAVSEASSPIQPLESTPVTSSGPA